MPEIIRFYLGEDPVLKNVPTWRCREKHACAHVLDRLDELVVKEVAGSGGYGMLIGPRGGQGDAHRLCREDQSQSGQLHRPADACPVDLADFRRRRHRPPPRRPAAVRPLRRRQGAIVPGGLTRVALKEGSLVVNSSQGGGTRIPGCWTDESSQRDGGQKRPAHARRLPTRKPVGTLRFAHPTMVPTRSC